MSPALIESPAFSTADFSATLATIEPRTQRGLHEGAKVIASKTVTRELATEEALVAIGGNVFDKLSR